MEGTQGGEKEGTGKRIRRPTTFAGFLTSDRQFDNLITGNRGGGVNDSSGQNRTTSTERTPAAKRPRQARDAVAGNGGAGLGSTVRKTPGVQNATRKILEWLQRGDMALTNITPNLPKLSRARVEVVLETLRAAGLIQIVRKHTPDKKGADTTLDVYRFSAGCTAAEALEIGGGVPVTLGSIAKRTRAAEQEVAGLSERLVWLQKENAKGAHQSPGFALELLRAVVKQERSLEEDPLYGLALKATTEAARIDQAEREAKATAEANLAAARAQQEAAETAARAAPALEVKADTVGAAGTASTAPIVTVASGQTKPDGGGGERRL
ncbi:unnamed protein product, partial [Discosporangium mesarthrocarpum]